MPVFILHIGISELQFSRETEFTFSEDPNLEGRVENLHIMKIFVAYRQIICYIIFGV